MPTDAEMLDNAMDMLDAIREVVAINTTIAGGLVDDPETVQDAARRSNEFLQLQLFSAQAMFSDDPVIKDAMDQAIRIARS